MGATPTADNKLADFFSGLIDLFIQGDEAAIKAYITIQAPFFEGPIVHIFTDEVVRELGSAIQEKMTQISTGIVITQQTGKEMGGVNDTYRKYLAAKLGGNPDEIKAARQAYLIAAASLSHSDGQLGGPK